MSVIPNAPIDQANTNSIRDLARDEAGGSRRRDEIEDKRENVEPERIQDRVAITPDGLQRSEESDKSRGAVQQPGPVRTNVLAEKSFGKNEQAETVNEQRRNVEQAVEQGFQQGNVQNQPVVANETKAASPGELRAENNADLEAGFETGNKQTDPSTTQEFSTRKQDDSPGAASVVEQRATHKEVLKEKDATAVETERGQNVSKMI